jgi:hypothetical protein
MKKVLFLIGFFAAIFLSSCNSTKMASSHYSPTNEILASSRGGEYSNKWTRGEVGSVNSNLPFYNQSLGSTEEKRDKMREARIKKIQKENRKEARRSR